MYDFYISLAISDLTGKKYDIEVELEKDGEKDGEKPKQTPAATPEHDNNNLNPRYTFDTFVIGDNNRMAHAASIAVAESPGKEYNPLFLYGGAGLGKTHLMHSIAHYIIEHNSSLNVLYVTSEDFTNEVINSIQHKKQEELRSKYRNIDVLLVDDIQFVIGKESTPFLLARVAELTGGDSLKSNIQLVFNNAILASEIAKEYQRLAG